VGNFFLLTQRLEIIFSAYRRIGVITLRIMIMAQNYAPDEVSSAVLLTELAIDLVKKGHAVTVITAPPSYPYGRVFPGYRNFLYYVEWMDDVRVVRTWSYLSPLKTFWRRLLNQGFCSFMAFFGGLLAGKPDILVIDSPPQPLGLSAWALSILWRVPWVLHIEDIFPESAVSMGVLRNRTAIAFFSAIERFLYRKATHISLISEGFRRNLLGKGAAPEKITVIPVWVDPDIVRPMPRENAFREKHGLNGYFVVMYAGNLGLTSCVEDILPSAELLLNEPNVRFVIIGERVKCTDLDAAVRSKNLTNVLFLPYQPREIFAEMMAAADVGIVTLNHNSSITSLSSKTFNIMASARPILAITPQRSEIAEIVRDADCGINVPPDQPVLLAETILKMMQQPAQMIRMGKNGRSQLENRFARSHCVTAYEQMLRDVYERSNNNRK
jgi:colanic acid biosynthesis glycosyl transferase WcaI